MLDLPPTELVREHTTEDGPQRGSNHGSDVPYTEEGAALRRSSYIRNDSGAWGVSLKQGGVNENRTGLTKRDSAR